MKEKQEKRARILKFIKNNKIKTHFSQNQSKRDYCLSQNSKYSQSKKQSQIKNIQTDRALYGQKQFFQLPRQYSNQNLTLKSKFKLLLEQNFKKMFEKSKTQKFIFQDNNVEFSSKEQPKSKQKNFYIKQNQSTLKFIIDKHEILKLKFFKFINKEIKIQQFLLILIRKSQIDKLKKSKKVQKIYLKQQFQYLLQFEKNQLKNELIKKILIINRYIGFFIQDFSEDHTEILQQLLNNGLNIFQQFLCNTEEFNTRSSNNQNRYQNFSNSHLQNQFENFQNSIDDFKNNINKNQRKVTVLISYLKKQNVNIDNFSIMLNSLKNAEQTKPKYPIEKEREKQYKYTLFLDLDETLIHFDPYQDLEKIHLRPHVHFFLQEMSKYYELIIFTAGKKEYADWAIDYLDKDKLIKYRLYQRHTKIQDGVYLKDIQSTGRQLKDSLIIDNLPENFSLHPNNGIEIKSYEGQKNDKELSKLIPILKQVAKYDRGNISYTLQQILKIKDQIIKK